MGQEKFIACVILAVSAYWICLAAKHGVSSFLKSRHKMAGTFVLAVLMCFAVIGKTNELMRVVGYLRSLSQCVVTVTEGDIARGWRVESVYTDETLSYEMPTNASYVGNLHVHGARQNFGCNKLTIDGLAFSIGTNYDNVSSFWYSHDGRIRPAPRDAVREIRAAGGQMFARLGMSRMWTAELPDGSRGITWENFYQGDDTNMPVNAQIRLYGNGDFTTSSNELVTVCRRIEPFDWDGDGRENSIDAEPCIGNDDSHGQGEGWVAACCTNAAEIALSGGYTNWVASKVLSDEDCIYYSFTITVDHFDVAGHSCVSIDGKPVVLSPDAPSATFLLLRGKLYPFSVTPAGTHFSSLTDGMAPIGWRNVELIQGSY